MIWLLFAAPILVVLLVYFWAKRGATHHYISYVEGKEVPVDVHFGHWLPRLLKARGFCMGGHIWSAFPMDEVLRVDMAHELIHHLQRHVKGVIPYTIQAIFQWMFQWAWKRRSTEEEAIRGEYFLARSLVPSAMRIGGRIVVVRAAWLEWFPL